MSVFKCKKCGGTLESEPGATVGVCSSCGTKQTLPCPDDDSTDSEAFVERCLDKAEICRKDAIYSEALELMSRADFIGATNRFEEIPGWKDADEKAGECRIGCEAQKAKQEVERLETERKAEERRIAAEKSAKMKKKIIAITAPVVCALIAFVVVFQTVLLPLIKYNKAVGLMDEGKYDEAISAFEAMNGYKDSADKIKDCNYGNAMKLMNEGQYDEAIAAFSNLSDYKDSADQIEKCYIKKYGEKKYNFIKNLKVGDICKFGSYEQNDNTSDGKEEIEWIVLERNGMSLMLISKYALDCQRYHDSYAFDVTWEACTLRTWLNETFINNAFSAEEQSWIQITKVTADKNPEYKIPPGNDTKDKIFLLSITEVNKYFGSDDARKCAPTAYTGAQGAYISGDNTVWWWLRSPGCNSDSAANVNLGGTVNTRGSGFTYSGATVRPALWINLEP